MGYNNPEEVIKRTTEETMKNIEERCHEYVTGAFQNRESVLVVWCPKHNNEHSTTFYNYNRSKTGCPCCGREVVSKKLTRRSYSSETLEKMKKAAGLRPLRGGKPRRWRETNSYRNWRNDVFNQYNNQCAVTGKTGEQIGDLVAHHLYCAKQHPNLIYVSENGIILSKEIHLNFHLTSRII